MVPPEDRRGSTGSGVLAENHKRQKQQVDVRGGAGVHPLQLRQLPTHPHTCTQTHTPPPQVCDSFQCFFLSFFLSPCHPTLTGCLWTSHQPPHISLQNHRSPLGGDTTFSFGRYSDSPTGGSTCSPPLHHHRAVTTRWLYQPPIFATRWLQH